MRAPKPDQASEPRLLTSSVTTKIGLFVAALGWVGLLAGPPLAPLAIRALHVDWVPPEAAGIATVSKNLIVSGFGLAILGAVQSGFQALNAFFEAVLRRSVAPKPERPRPEPVPAAPPPPAPPPVPKPDPNRIVERGRLKGRPFAAFADGSIEVETLLGPRRFASLEEARDFVGS